MMPMKDLTEIEVGVCVCPGCSPASHRLRASGTDEEQEVDDMADDAVSITDQ